MGNEREIIEIIHAIHSGKCSRNMHFDKLSRGSGRRAHVAYNRLTSLLAEISGEGSKVSVARVGRGDRSCHAFEVSVERMGYTHHARLSGWETRFFLDDLGGRDFLPALEVEL